MAQEQARSAGFLDSRTGWSTLRRVLLLEPLPGGSRWAAAFGSLLLFSFVVQVATGLLLAVNYAPSAETAWPSVQFIQEGVPLGAFIRAVHHWGSSAMVILLLAHLVQVFVWGAYKRPREFTWMVGVLLLMCVLGLAFTGYLLPWDQKAYWATKVGLGIASTTPVIGDDLQTLLQGGPQLGNLTLTRFFSLHTMLLPGLVIVLVIVHLYLFRVHGVTPSWWESHSRLKALEEPFWPKQALKDGVLALAFLLGLGLWAYYHPAPLEAQADPSQPYEARPEWYFMFLFQLLRYFHGPYEIVGTFVLPALFFLVLFFWPFLDRSPQRDPRRRPVAIGLLGLCTMSLIGLTIYAVATDIRMVEPTKSPDKAPPAEKAGQIQRADVAKVFGTNCVSCHGIDGSAGASRAVMPTIPDFTSMAWQMSQTELEITHRIQDGHEPLMPAYRDKLSAREILALTIYVRAFRPEATAANAAAAPPPAKPAPLPDASQMAQPQVFRAYCLACHDADGRGKTIKAAMPDIPDFTDAKWSGTRTDADLKHSILEGKGKYMLPMKDKLSPADADKMVKYIREFREGKQVVPVEAPKPVEPPPTKPAVKPTPTLPDREPAEPDARLTAATGLFRQYCLSCHGTDGRGSALRPSMPDLPDFTNREWQVRNSAPALAVSILEGKGTLMPAFRGRVNEPQARDLAAYVKAFGPQKSVRSDAPTGDFENQFRTLQDQWNELDKQLKAVEKSAPKRP